MGLTKISISRARATNQHLRQILNMNDSSIIFPQFDRLEQAFASNGYSTVNHGFMYSAHVLVLIELSLGTLYIVRIIKFDFYNFIRIFSAKFLNGAHLYSFNSNQILHFSLSQFASF